MNRDIPATTVEKWRKLFTLIVSLTDKNALRWSETAVEGEYISSYHDVSILIAKKRRRSTEGVSNYIEVRIQDAEGKEVDSFNDEDISDDPEFSEYYLPMNEFVKQLQRNISGAEQFLDKLIFSMARRNDDVPF